MVLESTTDTAEETARVLAANAVAPSIEKPAEQAEPEAVGGEEPPAAAAEAEEPEEATDREGRKKLGGFQRQIHRLKAEKAELEARLAAAGAGERLAAGERVAPEGEAKEEPAPAGKPKLADFESLEAYTEALTDWKLSEREAVRAREAEQAQLVKNWEARLKAAKTRYDDFEEIVQQDIALSDVMQQVLLESEAGADLAYWLGQNPEEAARIAALPPMAAHRALAKIEAGFGDEKPKPAPEKRRASAAPVPISPLGGRAAAAAPDVEKMTFQEFKHWRESGNGRQ